MRVVLLLTLVLAAGCNEIYGLEPTSVAPTSPSPPGPPDADGDGIIDELDNCAFAHNADQLDTDADTFGDACDACPLFPTAVNHDEDGDTHGDECDLCPAEPSFQLDSDTDGVGDACDNDAATDNTAVLFDPFLDLDAAWVAMTEPWFSTGDSASTGAAGTRLRHTVAMVDGTRNLWLRIGVSSSEPWRDGDRFGFELVDPTSDAVLAGCTIECSSGSCRLLRVPATFDLPPVLMPVPAATLAFNHALTVSACTFDTRVASEDRIVFGPAQLVLVASPGIHLRYVALYQ